MKLPHGYESIWCVFVLRRRLSCQQWGPSRPRCKINHAALRLHRHPTRTQMSMARLALPRHVLEDQPPVGGKAAKP